MPKEIIVPINKINKFTITNDDELALTVRYRLKDTQDSSQISEWSNPTTLKFLKPNGVVTASATILETNYDDAPTTTGYPVGLHGSSTLNLNATDFSGISSKIPTSEIVQLTANKENGEHYPAQDDYLCKWENPTDSNVKNFDVYTSWNMYAFLAKWATISTPVLNSSAYRGTITLSSSNTNVALSFKTYLDTLSNSSTALIYAAPGSVTPGNSLETSNKNGNGILDGTTVISNAGTIGTVSGSGPYTATITGMDSGSTANLFPGQIIIATAGTGKFGAGVMTVSTIASSTSITVSSTATFTAGTVTNIAVSAYGPGNVFGIQSASTWGSTGTITNLTRTHLWTQYEYAGTSPDNVSQIQFSRKMKSCKLTAIITKDGCTIKTNENLINYGVVPGMSLVKISGDGELCSGIISQVDYEENYIVLSNSQDATSTISQTFTIGSVDNSSLEFKTATITSATAFTSNLEVGQIITGAGGTGSLGSGAVKIIKINSSTSMDILSKRNFTAGTLTSISYPTKPTTLHTVSGDIVFVAKNESVTSNTNHNGTIETGIPITQYQLKPVFVQAIILAANDEQSDILSTLNNNTLWSITKTKATYFDAYATMDSYDTTLPFSLNLTSMSLPYSSSDRNIGLRIYGEKSSGLILPPTTTIVDYISRTSVTIKADSGIPANAVSSTYASTSSNSMTVPASKTWLVSNTSNALVVGMKIRAARTAAPTDYVEGIITSSSSTSITVYADTVGGTPTTSTNWTISAVGGLVTSIRI